MALAEAEAEAAPRGALVVRFGLTERTLHWVHTAGFLAMLATGLVLYLPPLSGLASRETTKELHLVAAIAWMTLLVLVAVSGDRRRLRRTRDEIEAFTPDDIRWLRRKQPAPQGRFNAGQKAHTVVQAALSVLFIVSGSLLWLGERVNAFRLPGSVALHDGTMYIATVLLLGHLFLALIWPKTRPAMQGVLHGTVPAAWAREHHAAWAAEPPPTTSHPRRLRRPLAGAAVLALGLAATLLITRSNLEGTPAAAGPAPVATTGPAPILPEGEEPPSGSAPLKPGADILSLNAQQASAQGDFPTAVSLLRQAVGQDEKRGDLQRNLGLALAQSGDLAGAQRTLERAVALEPKNPDGYFLLGAVQVQAGKRAAGRAELQRYLRARPKGSNAQLARKLLRG